MYSAGENLVIRTYAHELSDLYEQRHGDHYTRVMVKQLLDGTLEADMLNGAETWDDYSKGGSSLVYIDDLRARLAPTCDDINEVPKWELVAMQALALANAYDYIVNNFIHAVLETVNEYLN